MWYFCSLLVLSTKSSHVTHFAPGTCVPASGFRPLSNELLPLPKNLSLFLSSPFIAVVIFAKAKSDLSFLDFQGTIGSLFLILICKAIQI